MTTPAADSILTRCIVCFGDSVTEGVPHAPPADVFPAVLERRLNFRYGPDLQVRVINAGVSGENTFEGLARIERDVLAHEPALVAVEFGLNDIRYEPEKAVTEEQFAANLREMHARITAIGGGVIFMTPTPILNLYHPYSKGITFYDQWGGCDGLNAIYAQIIREVAEELDAPLCDIYGALVKEAVKSEFRGETLEYRDLSTLSRYISAQDGVHPRAAGQEFIAAELYAVIVSQELLVTEA